MPLTLPEAAKLAADRGETHRAAVIQTFAMESDILRVMPFRDIPGNAYSYNQEQALPGVAFRGVNESYTESTGVINPVTERLTIAGGDLDVDRFIVETSGAATRATHETMKIKSLAAKISNSLIKGDSTTTQKEFDGLQVRLTGDQVVSAGTGSGGAALSLAKVDEAIDAVDGANYLLMSKAMRRRFTTAARNALIGGHIDYTTDNWGRQVVTYADMPILIADHNADVYSTLAFNEAYSGGGGSTGTSIYVLSLGDGMLEGIQNGMMSVRDLGELDSTPAFRTRVEWFVSMALEHPRAACRLRDIQDAAITA